MQSVSLQQSCKESSSTNGYCEESDFRSPSVISSRDDSASSFPGPPDSKETRLSQPEIGQFHSNEDHSTEFHQNYTHVTTMCIRQTMNTNQPCCSSGETSPFQRDTIHSNKKCMLEDPAALHRACLRPNCSVQEIEELLRHDPAAASRSITMQRTKEVVNPLSGEVVTKLVREPYTYPLHLAIKSKVKRGVIEILVNAAPPILLIRDGSMQETPLSILLRHCPDARLVDMILLEAPECAFLRDRHDNTIVHVACARGVSIDVLRHLCIFYPGALERLNMHGKTPLELVQQRSCSQFTESMCNFLMELQQPGPE